MVVHLNTLELLIRERPIVLIWNPYVENYQDGTIEGQSAHLLYESDPIILLEDTGYTSLGESSQMPS